MINKRIIKKMINNAQKSKESIIKFLFWSNLIFIFISVSYISKTFIQLILIINFILTGTYIIIEKFEDKFDFIMENNKFSKSLNKNSGGS